MRPETKRFYELLGTCALVILSCITIAKVAEAAAGTARCTERGLQLTGKPWTWEGGRLCTMPTAPRGSR